MTFLALGIGMLRDTMAQIYRYFFKHIGIFEVFEQT